MSNWRGFVAPPGISDEARQELSLIIEELHAQQEWQDAVERNSWIDTYQVGQEFKQFIREEVATANSIVKELGL